MAIAGAKCGQTSCNTCRRCCGWPANSTMRVCNGIGQYATHSVVVVVSLCVIKLRWRRFLETTRGICTAHFHSFMRHWHVRHFGFGRVFRVHISSLITNRAAFYSNRYCFRNEARCAKPNDEKSRPNWTMSKSMLKGNRININTFTYEVHSLASHWIGKK